MLYVLFTLGLGVNLPSWQLYEGLDKEDCEKVDDEKVNKVIIIM